MARTRKLPRKRDRTGMRVLVALALSVLANLAAVWVAVVTRTFDVGRGPRSVTPVALSSLSASDWERNRTALPAKPVPRPEPKVVPPERGGTLVELPPEAPGAKPQPSPENARFLAERNQRVEKETVSRYAVGHAGNVLPVPQQGSPGSASAAKQPPPVKPKQERVAMAERPRGGEGARGDGRPLTPGEREDLRGGERGGRRDEDGNASDQPDLSVSPESIARIAGGPNMDGFGQAEEGEVTALNTREFKYATYMNQIRRRIGEAWYPKVDEAMRARDPEGKSFFYKQRTVTLSVTLDLSGRVTELDVLETSNIDFYDRLAIASVKQAQPFLNPPPGMFEHDGLARFPFSFTVYPADRRGVLFWRPPTDE